MSHDNHSPGVDSLTNLVTKKTSTFARVGKYLLARLATIVVMVIVGIFISIVIINQGGLLDKSYEAAISEAVPKLAINYPNLNYDEKAKILAQIKWDWEESLGLHAPFLVRCVRWTAEAMVFNTQDPAGTGTWTGRDQKFLQEILTRFPKTLLLVGTTNLLVFLVSLSLGLSLSKREGKFIDRLMSGLVPLSSIPNWAFAILLTAIFAWQLNILPAQGTYDMFPPKYPIGYVWIVFKHMILPMAALFLSIFFQLTYSWRSLFLVTGGEDYVELAKAKGLPDKMIERRYLIKPTMPYVITSFVLIFLSMWQGIIILERFFNWQGIGQYFQIALSAGNSSPLAKLQMTTLVVVFVYLLAATVFFLDIIYILLDPRIKIGGQEKTLQPVIGEKFILKNLFLKSDKPRSHRYSSTMVSPIYKRRQSSKSLDAGRIIKNEFTRFKEISGQVLKRPTAIAGLIIIFLLLMLMGYALIFIPQQTAVSLWSPVSAKVFLNPRLVPPAWTNLFRKNPLPSTIIINSTDKDVEKQKHASPNGTNLEKFTFRFNYSNDEFPQDLSVRLNTQFKSLASLVSLTWITPDGRTYELGNLIASNDKLFFASQDLPVTLTHLFDLDTRITALGGKAFSPVDVLFIAPNTQKIETAKGNYQLVVSVQNFEENASVTSTMVVYGKVFGLAGTDFNRRDLLIPLLWGIPVALVFGVLGATLTIFFSLLIAAISAWKGGWLDSLIQRVSEVNLVIPVIPLAIMFYFLFDKSIWAVLAVFVIFNIFGASLKNLRTILLQVREAPYIEAALAYGASDWRIIWHYLVPHLLPIVVPQWIILIPAYVFLEASLAFFGVFDPVLPTWGKLIYEAFTGGGLSGSYYWILEPVGMIVLVGLAFTLLGNALDDVLNPRLRKT